MSSKLKPHLAGVGTHGSDAKQCPPQEKLTAVFARKTGFCVPCSNRHNGSKRPVAHAAWYGLHEKSKAVMADCAIIHRGRGADVWVWRAVWRARYAQSTASSNHPKTPNLEQGSPHRPEATLAAKTGSAIRARLELANNLRDLALFNLAIDSKLRGCDLVCLKVGDLVNANQVRKRVPSCCFSLQLQHEERSHS